MTTKLSPSIRQLADKYRTRGALTHPGEFHDLGSLAHRVLLAPTEVLDIVAAGDLIGLHQVGNKVMFAAAALDDVRDGVVDLITATVVEELFSRGASQEDFVVALDRAFRAQTKLARTNVADLIELARDDDDDHTLRNAALLAGGAVAGYAYLRNRKRGTPQLPGGSGPEVDGDAVPNSPRPKGPSGSAGKVIDAMNVQHAGPPIGARPALPAPGASTAGADLLSQAVAKGRRAVTARGRAIWGALRSIPLE